MLLKWSVRPQKKAFEFHKVGLTDHLIGRSTSVASDRVDAVLTQFSRKFPRVAKPEDPARTARAVGGPSYRTAAAVTVKSKLNQIRRSFCRRIRQNVNLRIPFINRLFSAEAVACDPCRCSYSLHPRIQRFLAAAADAVTHRSRGAVSVVSNFGKIDSDGDFAVCRRRRFA